MLKKLKEEMQEIHLLKTINCKKLSNACYLLILFIYHKKIQRELNNNQE